MAYLHREGIVHGDLAGGNVLLTSASTPHGFCAKARSPHRSAIFSTLSVLRPQRCRCRAALAARRMGRQQWPQFHSTFLQS